MGRNKPAQEELPPAARPKDQYRHISGIYARYWTTGEGDPVVLVHGLGGSIDHWRYTIEPLAAYFQVYAPDLPGFGRSDKPREHPSFATQAEFLKNLMLGFGISRFHLVGHGAGGAIALHLAHEFPYMVHKLVLVAALGFGREVHWSYRLKSLPLLGELLTLPSRLNTRQTVKQLFYRHDLVTRECINTYYRLARLPGASRFFLAATRYSVDAGGIRREVVQSVQAQAREITAPTMIIWGREDWILPAAQAETARQLIAGAQLRILDECGHLPMVEKAQEFNELLLSFLSPNPDESV